MPFTFGYPAAAARLSRYGLNLSALVAGSMSPDFHYFVGFDRIRLARVLHHAEGAA
jgi:hypothetical protein